MASSWTGLVTDGPAGEGTEPTCASCSHFPDFLGRSDRHVTKRNWPGCLMQMAMSGGRGGGSLGQRQDGGGLGQFFRGDLPQKLGTLLVSGR